MKKKIIALFTSFLLTIPVFNVPVHAEEITETTYYWDGTYYGIDSDYSNLTLSGASRVVYNFVPNKIAYRCFSGSIYPADHTWLNYIWFIGSYSDSSVGQADATSFINNLDIKLDRVSPGASIYTRSNINSSNLTVRTYQASNSSTIDYYVLYAFNFSYVKYINDYYVYKHISGYNSGYDGSLISAMLSNQTTDSNIIIINYPAYSGDTLTRSGIRGAPTDHIINVSDNIDTAFAGMENRDPITSGYGDGTNVTYPDSDPEGEEGGENGSSGNYTLQQQQQFVMEDGAILNTYTVSEGAISNTQIIENGAVQVTVNNNDGITEETIQRLDQTLQNNNPYQTTFSTAVQTIDGFRQIGVKFAQTSEAFLDFLPSWVTDLLSLMFVLLFFFIVLRLLKVFHG